MIYVVLGLLIIVVILQAVIVFKKDGKKAVSDEIRDAIKIYSDANMQAQNHAMKLQDSKLSTLTDYMRDGQNTLHKTLTQMLKDYDERLIGINRNTDLKLESVRKTVEEKLGDIQKENNKKLEDMRVIVDTKLQETLNDRISKSFNIVSERLSQVYAGLGEMQNLAVGVGDLKRTLTNVKTRGIFGEIQLSSILSDILAKEQYEENVKVNPESSTVVEFAVKLPGDDDKGVYLPIDAKFPLDAYNDLIKAYDSGDTKEISSASKEFESRIKKSAKDISTKYICPPYTTDFAIMFLPTEGIYSEVIKTDLYRLIQKEYSIVAVGPTNMAAFLNSLQMGFKTLAIQKRTSEVWKVLESVKTEFDKFADALLNAQRKIDSASSEINNLVGTRTRMMQKKLKLITNIDEENGKENLPYDEEERL